MKGAVLALDLARAYGWCEGEPGGEPRFGSGLFAKADATQEEVFAGAIREIGSRLATFPPRVLVYEEPELYRLRDGKATKATIEVLFGLPAVVQGVAHRFGVRVIRKAATGDVRKFFIGQRRMPRVQAKIAVVNECRRRGWEVRNDDEGDACAIWAFTCAALVPALRVVSAATPLLAEVNDKSSATHTRARG